LRPLSDALNERLGGRRVNQLMGEGAIEIAPIAYMRGRTLNNAFIVIDEAQNCTYGQIKMILTRLGWHSTMVVTGDPDRSDLLDGLSGLAEIARRLEPIAGIAVVRLADGDIVRHPLVGDMLAVLRAPNARACSPSGVACGSVASAVTQLTQKLLRREQIGGAETFRETVVDRLQSADGVRWSTLILDCAEAGRGS
jgi:hypothetical protein